MTKKNKDKIKGYIEMLTESQVKQFKRIFSYNNQSLSIDDILNKMDSAHTSSAIRLCRTSAEHNLKSCFIEEKLKYDNKKRKET